MKMRRLLSPNAMNSETTTATATAICTSERRVDCRGGTPGDPWGPGGPSVPTPGWLRFENQPDSALLPAALLPAALLPAALLPGVALSGVVLPGVVPGPDARFS